MIILQTEKIQLTEGVTQDPCCTVIYEETVTLQAIRFCALTVILQKAILEYVRIRDQVDEALPYKDPEKGRAKKREHYLKNAEKIKARSSKRYEEKKDEISAKTKEDRKINPEKYRLRHQKEKAKDPEGHNAKKRANWAKHKIRNRPRVNKRTNELHHEKKEIVYTHYSKKLSNSDVPCCNCCGYTGIEFLTVDHIIPKREMEKKVTSLVRSISENVLLTPKEIAMGYNAKRKGHPLNQWLITNNFPKGFQILCWNCNFAKGSPAVSFKCPHEK